MRKKLEKHVNQLFKNSRKDPAARELREEVLQNTLDRFEEEIAAGKSEQEAYRIAVNAIGDIELAMEQTEKRPRKKKFTLLCAIITVICVALVSVACAFTSIEYYDEPDSYSIGSGSVSGELTRLDIDWHAGSVSIITYDGDEIELKETDVSNTNQKMRYRLRSGVLSVKYQASGINISSPISKKLEIRIPQEIALTSASLELASADATLKNLTIDRLEIESASGNLLAEDCVFRTVEAESASGDQTFKNCTMDSAETDAASGNTKIEGSVKKLAHSSASGDLTLSTDITPSELEIDTASGNIKVTLPSDAQFTCEYETASGNVKINGFSGNYQSEKFVCGESTNRYELESASGNITLNAAQ